MDTPMPEMNDQQLTELKFALYPLSEAVNETTGALTFMSITNSSHGEDLGIREHIVHAYQQMNCRPIRGYDLLGVYIWPIEGIRG